MLISSFAYVDPISLPMMLFAIAGVLLIFIRLSLNGLIFRKLAGGAD
jgi:hypothetical protein